MAAGADRPQVFAALQGKEILGEMGRLAFSAINLFSAGGSSISLLRIPDMDALAAERPYLSFVTELPNVTVVDRAPANARTMVYVSDKRNAIYWLKDWRKRIHIAFDIFSAQRWSRITRHQPLIMPYPMHPVHYRGDLRSRLRWARSADKKMKIFFSGDSEGYVRNRIFYPTAKLTRSEVVATIGKELRQEIQWLRDAPHLAEVTRGDYKNGYFMFESSQFRVPSQVWLETLARAEFFLCPPGYVMPMCHNAVEAMAVGTIPIINYPEWFTPPLRDMENCVEFQTKEDLVKKIRKVLSMPKEEVRSLGAKALRYYERFLAPERFLDRVEESKAHDIKLLMVTDAYVARNATKLNASSWLMRTPSSAVYC